MLAQYCVFEEAEENLKEFLGLKISGKQIQRVSEHYGCELEKFEGNYQEEEPNNQLLSVVSEAPNKQEVLVEPNKQEVPAETEAPNKQEVLVEPNKQEVPAETETPNKQEIPVVTTVDNKPVYIMIDGSMVNTREEKWKEMKVGRIYSESSRVAISKDRIEVTESLYVCTLGSNKEFFKKFKPYVEPYMHKNKVFIADGAKWIWNWVEYFYCGSVQILDFYHAAEKLGTYAKLAYKDKKKRDEWLHEQKNRLKKDEVENVIKDLEKDAEKTNPKTDTGKALNDVIRYYQNNIARMKYGSFIEKGYLIGSGAVESAHRNVIQQRLKLSGQRWSIDGAQRIANLRAYKKSNRWKILIGQIKNAA